MYYFTFAASHHGGEGGGENMYYSLGKFHNLSKNNKNILAEVWGSNCKVSQRNFGVT